MKITVVSPEFCKLGYRAEAHLTIEPKQGVYWAEFWLNQPNSERREVAWEPAEPNRQQLGVRFASENHVDTVLDLMRIDIWRREEEAERRSE